VLSADDAGGFRILAAHGDNALGGRDFDLAVRRWVETELAEQDPGLLVALHEAATVRDSQRLEQSIRNAKELLSEAPSAMIEARVGARNAMLSLTRPEFEQLISTHMARAVALTRSTLETAGALGSDALRAIYLTGGSARIPKLHRDLGQLGPIATLDDPKTVVAQGAIHAVLRSVSQPTGGFPPDPQFPHPAPRPQYQPGPQYQPAPPHQPAPQYQPGPQYQPAPPHQPGSQYQPAPPRQPQYQLSTPYPPPPTAAPPPRDPRPAAPDPVRPVGGADVAPPGGPRRGRGAAIAVAGVAIVAVAAVAAWLALRPTHSASAPTAQPDYTVTAVAVGHEPQALAVDSASHTAYIADDPVSAPQSIYLLDTVTRAVKGTIPLQAVADMAIDPVTHTVYAGQFGGSVSAIDPNSHSLITTVQITDEPGAIAEDPATHLVYTVDSDKHEVTVVDIARNTVVGRIPTGPGPQAVADDSAAHTLYVANGNATALTSPGSVTVIDTNTRTVIGTVPVGSHPTHITVDPDNHLVYVSNLNDGTVSILDTTSHTVVGTVAVGSDPGGTVIDPDTHAVYLATAQGFAVLDATSHKVIDTVRTDFDGQDIGLDTGTHTIVILSDLDKKIALLTKR
jgi:YVTN family beta-propeller protein